MSRQPFALLCIVAVAALVVVDGAAIARDPQPPVSVTYVHPERFTEARETRAMAPLRVDQSYLPTLARYIQQRAAPLLADGQTLAIVVTDIDRAGAYEPGRGPQWDQVRIVKDAYPPRIDLRFTVRDGRGQVVRQGQRTLRDLGFLSGQLTTSARPDPLRYEKHLIDHWLHTGLNHL